MNVFLMFKFTNKQHRKRQCEKEIDCGIRKEKKQPKLVAFFIYFLLPWFATSSISFCNVSGSARKRSFCSVKSSFNSNK